MQLESQILGLAEHIVPPSHVVLTPMLTQGTYYVRVIKEDLQVQEISVSFEGEWSHFKVRLKLT